MRKVKKLLSGAGAAVAVKIVTGFAVTVLAAAAAGAVTEAAVTGSLNPADWGQQVKHQVAVCKETLRASGVRGIGQCVSAFAKQHGKIVSAEHRASGARTNHGDNGKGHSNNHGNGKGNGKGNGQDNGQPGHKPDNTPKVVTGRRRRVSA